MKKSFLVLIMAIVTLMAYSAPKKSDRYTSAGISYELFAKNIKTESGKIIGSYEYPVFDCKDKSYQQVIKKINQRFSDHLEKDFSSEHGYFNNKKAEWADENPIELSQRVYNVSIKEEKGLIFIGAYMSQEVGGPHPNNYGHDFVINTKTKDFAKLFDVFYIDDAKLNEITNGVHEEHPDLNFAILKNDIKKAIKEDKAGWEIRGKNLVIWFDYWDITGTYHGQGEFAAIVPLPDFYENHKENSFENFLAGKNTVSFSYYMKNVFFDTGWACDGDPAIASKFSAEKEYTLSEFKDTLNRYFNNSVKDIEYAFIDCGDDGIKELLVSISGTFFGITRPSFVIKEINSKLQVVYIFYESVSLRTKINEYGFFTTIINNDQNRHFWNTGCLNSDCKYIFCYYEEDFDINFFAKMARQPVTFDLSQIDGTLRFYSLRTESYDSNKHPKEYYSYEVYYPNTCKKIENLNVYTSEPYKTIMKSFKGIDFTTMDELEKIKEDKLKEIGVTEKIKNGKYPEYTKINVK